MKNRLPHQPQPVPPIYQPELAADAIVWAAAHHPREVNVGTSTTMAIWGNKFIPGWLDHYLARTAFAGQQAPEPKASEDPVNLWHAADEYRDFGAHGKFDTESRSHSWQWLAAKHRQQITAAVGAMAILGCAIRIGQVQREHERS
jgi:hypothetical protein